MAEFIEEHHMHVSIVTRNKSRAGPKSSTFVFVDDWHSRAIHNVFCGKPGIMQRGWPELALNMRHQIVLDHARFANPCGAIDHNWDIGVNQWPDSIAKFCYLAF